MQREELYLKLPVGLQNLACSFEGWRVNRKRYSPDFHRKLSELESRSFASPDEIHAFRDARLSAFVQHAFEHVPYYRRLSRQLGISAHDIRTFEDLRVLPILTKPQVQQTPADFQADNIPNRDCKIVHTSGTTGAGLRFRTTLDADREQWAVWWRYRRSHGIQLNTWCAYFGGRSLVPLAAQHPPFWRYNYPARQVMFSAYHMNPRNLPFYVAELRRARAPWLHGYPSLLTLVATHLLETSEPLGYQPAAITCGAENLLPQQRHLIHQAFGITPVQHYGMAEAVGNISQCEQGAMHVDEDFAALEFIDDGRIIGTNFTNFATPLLRYDVHDRATLTTAACSCGRPGRLIDSVDGREEDYVVLPNGAKLGRMDHILKNMVNIREAQIYQRDPSAIIFRVVKAPTYTHHDEEQLLTEIRRRVGPDLQVTIDYLPDLQRSSTGKLRFVVSDLRPGKLISSIMDVR